MRLLFYLYSICFILFFSGCEKEDKPLMDWRELEPFNIDNPHDIIGQTHNEWIEFYLKACLSGSEIKILDPVDVLLPLILEIDGINPSDEIVKTRYETFKKIHNNPGSTQWLNKIVGYSVSEPINEFFQKTTSVIDNLDENKPELAISDLKKIAVWINTLELRDEEKFILFGMNAISTYSTAFWSAEYINLENKKRTDITILYETRAIGPGWWDQLKKWAGDIIKADVKGAGDAISDQIIQGGMGNVTIGCATGGAVVGSIGAAF